MKLRTNQESDIHKHSQTFTWHLHV
jgi:hypothetical protein